MADSGRWWRILPAQGSDRSFGALRLHVCASSDDNIDDTGTWLRGRVSNSGPIGYESIELPLLHPASQGVAGRHEMIIQIVVSICKDL